MPDQKSTTAPFLPARKSESRRSSPLRSRSAKSSTVAPRICEDAAPRPLISPPEISSNLTGRARKEQAIRPSGVELRYQGSAEVWGVFGHSNGNVLVALVVVLLLFWGNLSGG